MLPFFCSEYNIQLSKKWTLVVTANVQNMKKIRNKYLRLVMPRLC